MSSRSVPLGAICAVGGPAAIGAIVGMQSGLFAAAHEALAAPAILFGVTALTIPALYIATAFARIAPPARRFARAVGEGLSGCGIALLGLAAPTAFLAATTGTAESASLVGAAAIAAAILVGMRALYLRLFEGAGTRIVHHIIYGCWSALALLLGALFWSHRLVA
jgi:hypothetical protein